MGWQKFQAPIFEQHRKDKTTHKIRDNMPKTLLNSFINLMPSTPQKRLYETTNIINKASRIIYGYYYAYWMDCISSYEVPLFFNTIINRPFHWNHFCTSMSSVILHDDTISDCVELIFFQKHF